MTRLFPALLLLSLGACARPPYQPLRPQALPAASSSDAPFEWGQSSFRSADSLELYEQWWRPKAGARAAVIVMHGLKDHSSRYSELAERLTREGIAVYAFDLRGHAHSEGGRVTIESFRDYVGDLGIYRKMVAEREQGKPLFLFGHSMGGAIITLSALDDSSSLAGLIVHAAALRADVPWPKKAGTRLVAAVAPRAGVFQLDLEDFSRDPAVVKQVEADPWVYQPAAPARTAAELLKAMDTINERMEELKLPLLILHGDADTVTSPQGSRSLHQRAQSKDKTLKLYPGLAHDLMHEPERDVVITDVLSWLDARVPQPAVPEHRHRSSDGASPFPPTGAHE